LGPDQSTDIIIEEAPASPGAFGDAVGRLGRPRQGLGQGVGGQQQGLGRGQVLRPGRCPLAGGDRAAMVITAVSPASISSG
jgi:hypothetical protein